MKIFLTVLILLTATLFFTGCQQADLPAENTVPEDIMEQEIIIEIIDEFPEEWAKLIVVYEKDGLLMLAKGGNTPQILIDELEFSSPLLSPDGKHLLYAITYYDEREGYDGEYAGSYYDLWLTDLDVGTTKPFVTEEMLRPAKDLPIGKYLPWLSPIRVTWLNSGNKIAFVSHMTAHVWGFNNNDLWLADLVTGEVIELLPDEMGGSFAFSPDGALLLVANSTSVSLMDSSGDQRLEVLKFSSISVDYEKSYVPQPVWAPDSSYGLVALIGPDSFSLSAKANSFEEPGNVEIWKIYRDGSTEKLLDINWPQYHELMTGNIFSPDSRSIVSSLESDLVSGARLINLEGEIITTFDYFSTIINWSPDGRMLLVKKDDQLVMLRTDGREVSYPYASANKWTSPTKFVVLQETQLEGYELWLVDLNGRKIMIDTGVSGEFDALLID